MSIATIAHPGILPARRWRLAPYGYVSRVLGLVLILAAVLKAHELATVPLPSTALFGSRVAAVILVEIELLLGIWLLWNLLPRITWRASMVLFAIFAVVAAGKGALGAESCGCFGKVRINPWHMFAGDLIACLALALSPPQAASDDRPTLRRMAGYAACAIGAAAPAWLGMTVFARPAAATAEAIGDQRLVIIDPPQWMGKQFPLAPYIDIGTSLTSGAWTIVLYHHDCPACRKALPQYRELARQAQKDPALPRVALIETPPYGTMRDNSGPSPAVYGRLDQSREWFVQTPATFSLQDGLVLKGENPAAH